MKNLLVVWKITEKDCNILHVVPTCFHRSSKSKSYLMSIYCRGPLNLSIPTFGKINQTETMINLLLLGKSVKNDCSYLCWHPKFIKTIFKISSYLMSISRHSPINPSTLSLPNISLTKTIIAITSISTLVPLIWATKHFIIWRHFPW